MGKDLKGRELGKGLYQRKDGRYEARTKINGSDVSIYGFNLRELKKEFQELKEEAQNSIDFRRKHITLNEWFEEWFQTVRRHFKWSGNCTVAANKNLPIKAVTHTACGKKRHAFFLHRTGKAV